MKLVNLSGPQDVLALLMRRKWWILLPFVALSAGVILITSMLPRMYVSESLIIVMPRDLPTDFVKDLMAGSTPERLTLITERVLSDSNLNRILDEIPIPELQSLNAHAQTIKLRDQIDVQFGSREQIPQGQTAGNIFRITCQNRDPLMAQKIVNRLIDVFKQEDRNSREENVNQFATFLQNQFDDISEKLAASDTRLKALRSRRRNELPTQEDSNLRRLETLASENTALRRERQNYVLAMQQLDEQILDVPKEIPKPATPKTQAPKDPKVEEYKVQFAILKALVLGRGYTSEHPSVKIQDGVLERLEERMTPEQIALGRADDPASTPEDVETKQSNPLYTKMEGSREYFTAQIQYIDQKTVENDKAIDAFKRHLDNAPQAQQELADVLRENNDLSRQHQEMGAKLAAARLSEEAENQQRGSQLEVVDRASLPLTPTKPAIPRILIAGVALSLLIALALGFLVDVVQQKTWTQSDITHLVGVKVLVEVPRIVTRDAVAKAQKRKAGFLTSVGVVGAAYVVFLFLVYTNPGFVLRKLDPLIQTFY